MNDFKIFDISLLDSQTENGRVVSPKKTYIANNSKDFSENKSKALYAQNNISPN